MLQSADDVKIYRETYPTTDCLIMQDDVEAVLNWCLKNNLVLSFSKTKVVSFTRKTSCIEHPYTVLGSAIARPDTIRNLGVLFDSRLSFTKHVSIVVNDSYTQMLGAIS